MKKYGVYVKFSNAEEFAQLGGYSDNEDNVVARFVSSLPLFSSNDRSPFFLPSSRTPAKNAMNLEQLKQSVMELVNPKVRYCSALSRWSSARANLLPSILVPVVLLGQGLHRRDCLDSSSIPSNSPRREVDLHPRHRVEDELGRSFPKQGIRFGHVSLLFLPLRAERWP